MDSDLSKMKFKFLEEFRMNQYSNLVTLQLEADPGKAAQVTNLEKFVEKLDAEIERREKDGKFVEKFNNSKEKVQTEGFATNNFTSHQIKSMSNVIATEVPIFSSGLDVHTWLNKLESYYKLYVATDSTGVMEGFFVQAAKSRLCSEYLHSMFSSSDATDTFENMATYMKKNHASKMSVFQALDTLWEMDKKESESYRDFGIRLDDKAIELNNIIDAKFKESNEGSEMKICDVYKLVSGQVFLQNLKMVNPVIYNNICNDLDKTWSAKEIALKAMTYKDRMASSDNSQNQGNVPDAFSAHTSDTVRIKKRDIKNCPFFLKGHCKFGEKCHSLHDEGLRKFINENCEFECDDKNEKNSNHKNGKNSNNKKGKNVTFSSFVATKEESLDEEDWRYNGTIPMVPLPTQNFRE